MTVPERIYQALEPGLWFRVNAIARRAKVDYRTARKFVDAWMDMGILEQQQSSPLSWKPNLVYRRKG